MMIKNTKHNTRLLIFAHDLAMVPIAWILAFWVEYNLATLSPHIWKQIVVSLPIVIGIQAFAFWQAGLYRGVWRFASLPDLARIVKSICLGAAVSLLTIVVLFRSQTIPHSIIPIYILLLIPMLGGPRFVVRWYKDYSGFYKQGPRVLVVGAGDAGEGIVRDIFRSSNENYIPVAFLDDDGRKLGQDVHGLRVIGKTAALPEVVITHDIDLIIIAVPSASAKSMRRIVEVCESTEVPFRTLPGLKDLASGRVSMQVIRNVSLEDLLGREAAQLDWDSLRTALRGQTVLVSGGGGSIGSELCFQILALEPKELIVVEHSEYNIYALEQNIKARFEHSSYHCYLGSVTDKVLLNEVFGRHHPDVVFHAAAYKHVPVLEHQLRAALVNNVLGTNAIAQVAMAHHVKKFVLVSTDKAVNPHNLMGRTKRLAEILCHNYNEISATAFLTVRFGNVLGSTGSVIPLFQSQIEKGGPITVTHPDITRYFMTIEEAAKLIAQAMVIGTGGELFVLDMGEPIKIRYLAEQMIRLSGYSLKDIEIVYSGLRSGEKLYEELFYSNEVPAKTASEQIFKVESVSVEESGYKEIISKFEAICSTVDDRAVVREVNALLECQSVVYE